MKKYRRNPSTTVNDISVRKEEGHLYLGIAGSTDEIKFVDFARKVAYRNFVFEFSDGTRAVVDLTNMVMMVAE